MISILILLKIDISAIVLVKRKKFLENHTNLQRFKPIIQAIMENRIAHFTYPDYWKEKEEEDEISANRTGI